MDEIRLKNLLSCSQFRVNTQLLFIDLEDHEIHLWVMFKLCTSGRPNLWEALSTVWQSRN